MSKSLKIDILFIILAGMSLIILILLFGAESIGKLAIIPILIAYFLGKYNGAKSIIDKIEK